MPRRSQSERAIVAPVTATASEGAAVHSPCCAAIRGLSRHVTPRAANHARCPRSRAYRPFTRGACRSRAVRRRLSPCSAVHALFRAVHAPFTPRHLRSVPARFAPSLPVRRRLRPLSAVRRSVPARSAAVSVRCPPFAVAFRAVRRRLTASRRLSPFRPVPARFAAVSLRSAPFPPSLYVPLRSAPFPPSVSVPLRSRPVPRRLCECDGTMGAGPASPLSGGLVALPKIRVGTTSCKR